jgi:hypothetical protein
MWMKKRRTLHSLKEKRKMATRSLKKKGRRMSAKTTRSPATLLNRLALPYLVDFARVSLARVAPHLGYKPLEGGTGTTQAPAEARALHRLKGSVPKVARPM